MLTVNCEGDTNHFVCVINRKWNKPWIKDYEREDRGSLREIYSIKDPTQIRLSDWVEALKNKTFEESLLSFFYGGVERWFLCTNFRE